ncbi:MAG TPA: hypothetical protein VKU86_08315 [Acidimicrobiales bacterium]|nr:hypothetical protein [Acidimicrobiales bacterium]
MTSQVLAEVEAAVAVVDHRAATALAVLEDVAGDPPTGTALVDAPEEPRLVRPASDAAATADVALAPVGDVPARPRGRKLWGVGALAAAVAAVVSIQLARPVGAPALHAALAKLTAMAARQAHLPWPATGEAAVAVPAVGMTVQSGPESPVPVASLTKVMTAYVILQDHPLASKNGGPAVTLTAADQAEAAADLAANATAVPVQPGESLTERQLLDGLLVHSANNFADVLAKWDVGSIPAFVTKMNATAAALGMAATHYVDASGLDDHTVSTAADQLRVAAAAMAIPTFAAVVAQPTVTFPIAGPLQNYVTAVGTDGVVGVKSGFTQAAMGCLVLAANRSVAGRDVLVLAAVTGQPPPNPLGQAQQGDLKLVDAVPSALRQVSLVTRGATVARVDVPWGSPVRATADGSVSALLWPTETVRETFAGRAVRSGEGSGADVGTLAVSVGGHRSLVNVRLSSPIGRPSLFWRLAHG